MVALCLAIAYAEPLRPEQTYPAGSTIEASGLGYELTVPPGLTARLEGTEEAPGVALFQATTDNQIQVFLTVLPQTDKTALNGLMPARLNTPYGSANLAREVRNNNGNLVAEYLIQDKGIGLLRVATLLNNGSRLLLSAYYTAAGESRVGDIVDRIWQALKPTTTASAVLKSWQSALESDSMFTGYDAKKEILQAFFICNGAKTFTFYPNSVLPNGIKGNLTLVPLNAAEAALLLTTDSERTLFRLARTNAPNSLTVHVRIGNGPSVPLEFTEKNYFPGISCME